MGIGSLIWGLRFVGDPTSLLIGIPLYLFQYLSLLNPLRHYVAIVRGMLLKGVGLEVLWPQAIALLLFATILLSVSVNQFRRQLS